MSWWRPWEDEAAPEVWKGLAAGAVAGLAATAAMSLVQAGLDRLTDGATSGDGEPVDPATMEPGAPAGAAAVAEEWGPNDPGPVPIEAAEDLARGEAAGPAVRAPRETLVQLGVGTTVGGVYGALAELAPGVKAGQGLALGTGLMLLADEVAMPALGMRPSLRGQSTSKKVACLVSHLVYGVTCELLRQQVRTQLDRRF